MNRIKNIIKEEIEDKKFQLFKHHLEKNIINKKFQITGSNDSLYKINYSINNLKIHSHGDKLLSFDFDVKVDCATSIIPKLNDSNEGNIYCRIIL